MKKHLAFLCFLYFLPLFSQIQKAITDTGKEIILFDDKTWRFVHESDSATLETISTNPSGFTKDVQSTGVTRSSNVNMVVYHHPKRWQAMRNRFQNIEYFFTGPDHTFATLTADSSKIPNLRIVKDVVIANVRQAVDYFRLKESEYRTVNGKKMLYLRYIAISRVWILNMRVITI